MRDRWLTFMQAYGRKRRSVTSTVGSIHRLQEFFDARKPVEEINADALLSYVRGRQSGRPRGGCPRRARSRRGRTAARASTRCTSWRRSRPAA
jgi:hypothetical protein